MVKREASKCRIWERERRDRLKSCFTALSKLLPSYDPSSPPSKIEILQRAATLISELQNKNEQLLARNETGSTTAVEQQLKQQKDELARLHERVKKLLTRNEQLCGLLQTAGLRVPSECGTGATFRAHNKWSYKISPQIAHSIAKKFSESCKRPAPKPITEKTPKKNKKKSVVVKKSASSPNENIDSNNKPKKKRAGAPNSAGRKTSTKAPVLGAPVYTSPSLGPGTLILADGSVLPVVQPPGQQQSAVAAQSTTTTLIVMQPPATLTRGPRTIACRPGLGAKVPIPPLRHRTLSLQPPTIPVRNPRLVKKKKSVAAAMRKAIEENNTQQQLEQKAKDKNNIEKQTTKEVNNQVKENKNIEKPTDSAKATDSIIEQIKETVVSKKNSASEQTNNPQPKESVVAVTTEQKVKEKQTEEKQCENKISNIENKTTSSTAHMTTASNKPLQLEQTFTAPETTHMELEPSTNLQPFQFNPVPCDNNKKAIGGGSEQKTVVPEPPQTHSELSTDDIFATLTGGPGSGNHQGPGGHHPESMSPTAAFLLAFPLVSTLTAVSGSTGGTATAANGQGAVGQSVPTNSSRAGAPEEDSVQDAPTLLQIGTMESVVATRNTAPRISVAPAHSGLLALDTFSSFFNSATVPVTTNSNQPTSHHVNTTKMDFNTHVNSDKNNFKNPVKMDYPQKSEFTNVNVKNTFATNTNLNAAKNEFKQSSVPKAEYMMSQTVKHRAPENKQCVPQYTQAPYIESLPPKEQYMQPGPQNTQGKTGYSQQQCNTFNPFSDIPATGDKTYSSSTSYATCSYTGTEYSYLNGETGACSKPAPRAAPSRAPVNWMTTPDVKSTAQNVQPSNETFSSAAGSAPPFPNLEFPSTGGGQWCSEEESQRWSWSPGRLLPPLLANGQTGDMPLPTLIGDLALGPKDTTSSASSKPHTKKPQHYDINTFSVSQLVESQQRSRGKAHKRKPVDACYTSRTHKWQQDAKRYKASYSAESLIADTRSRSTYQTHGHQQPHHQQQHSYQQVGQPQQHFQQQQAVGGQASTWPSEPLQQDYHNFTAPGYRSAPAATVAPFHNQPYQQEAGHGSARRQCSSRRQRAAKPAGGKPHSNSTVPHAASTSGGVASGSQPDHLVPPYVELRFLSMPPAMGSPLLSEETAATHPPPPPPPIYYGRHYGGGSPGAANTSLTNFNLTTIFPEMGSTNKSSYVGPFNNT